MSADICINVNVHASQLKDDEIGHTVYKHDDGRLDFITIDLGGCSIFVNQQSFERLLVEMRKIQNEFDTAKAE